MLRPLIRTILAGGSNHDDRNMDYNTLTTSLINALFALCKYLVSLFVFENIFLFFQMFVSTFAFV